jgi:protein O-mannosyl-transferase
MTLRSSKYSGIVLGGVILAVTAAVYWGILKQEFVDFDDPGYVIHNKAIQQGITSQSVGWAFTSLTLSNYHPLTWLSLMADYRIGEGKPWAFKLTNLLLHLGTTLLLYVLLARMTRRVWPSALVAGLFALHPLHVESVAWITERKDVLSTFFAFATLIGYHAYTRRPGVVRYLLMILLFAAGLLAKPMLVTLPFAMLVLDFWPLERWGGGQGKSAAVRANGKIFDRLRGSAFWPIIEKVPLLIMAAASCWITWYAQSRWGAVRENYSLGVRVGNAVVGYVRYLGKTFWPDDLAVLYLHTGTMLPIWEIIAAGALLAAITVIAVVLVRRRRWLAAGWFWYIGTLVPVIGLIQVGNQAIADRYTYIPLIGIFIMLAWMLDDLATAKPKARSAVVAGCAMILIVLSWLTVRQAAVWQDSLTLNRQALKVDPKNFVANNNLGILYGERKQYRESEECFRRAIAVRPQHPDIHFNLSKCYYDLGRWDESMAECNEALRIQSNFQPALRHRVMLNMDRNHYEPALADVRRLHELDPRDNFPQCQLVQLLFFTGRFDEGMAQFQRFNASRRWPEAFYQETSDLLNRLGRKEDAARVLEYARQAGQGR